MPTVTLQKYPAISVVIPMYNTEKYIGACLTSLLAQTFPNFEVIVVDDGSTDNSCAVVESFIPKFGGRLKLVRSSVNRGPAVPTNKGISLSRGKYIYLVDSDDLVVSNAFEILYKYAEDFNVDMIHMDLGFRIIKNNDQPFPTNKDVIVVGWHSAPFVTKPTLESDNLEDRSIKWCRNGYGWTGISKFVRRDMLMENDITIPNLRTLQDVLWSIKVIMTCKKILTVPNPLYVHRPNPTSNTVRKRTTEQKLHFLLEATTVGLKILEEFLSSKKFFQENPKYKYDIMRFVEGTTFNDSKKEFNENPPHKIYEIIKPKFVELFGENGALISYLIDSSHFLRWNLVHMSQRIAQLENQVRELQKPK